MKRKVINLLEARADLMRCSQKFITSIKSLAKSIRNEAEINGVEILAWEQNTSNSIIMFMPEKIGKNIPEIFVCPRSIEFTYSMDIGNEDQKFTVYIAGLQEYEGLVLAILLMAEIFTCPVKSIMDMLDKKTSLPPLFSCKDHYLYQFVH